MVVTTRWETSSRPLFVKTVWKDGQRHVVLRRNDEEIVTTRASTRRSTRRTGSKKMNDVEVENKQMNLRVPSVKMLLASLRDFKKAKRCKTEDFSGRFKSALTIDIIPSDSVRYSDLNKQVSFDEGTRHRPLQLKSNSLEIQDLSTPPLYETTDNNIDHHDTLSERVMIWLDLAVQNSKPSKTVVAKKRVVTAQPLEIKTGDHFQDCNFPEKPQRYRKITAKNQPSVVSRVECERVVDFEGERRVRVRANTARRQLHIFLPHLPKKTSDSGSFLSGSKGSKS